MGKTDKKNQKLVANIIDILNKEKLDASNLICVLSTLLFSVGASLEDCVDLSSEKVLTMFATKPTLGNALMAQALHMKETWIKEER